MVIRCVLRCDGGVVFGGEKDHVARVVGAAFGERDDVVELVAWGDVVEAVQFEERGAGGGAARDFALGDVVRAGNLAKPGDAAELRLVDEDAVLRAGEVAGLCGGWNEGARVCRIDPGRIRRNWTDAARRRTVSPFRARR